MAMCLVGRHPHVIMSRAQRGKKKLKGIEEKKPIKLIIFLTGLPLKSMCVMVS